MKIGHLVSCGTFNKNIGIIFAPVNNWSCTQLANNPTLECLIMPRSLQKLPLALQASSWSKYGYYLFCHNDTFTCWRASRLSFRSCRASVTSHRPTVFTTGEGWWESDRSFLLYLTFRMKPQEVPSLHPPASFYWRPVPVVVAGCRADMCAVVWSYFSLFSVIVLLHVIVLISHFLSLSRYAHFISTTG